MIFIFCDAFQVTFEFGVTGWRFSTHDRRFEGAEVRRSFDAEVEHVGGGFDGVVGDDRGEVEGEKGWTLTRECAGGVLGVTKMFSKTITHLITFLLVFWDINKTG